MLLVENKQYPIKRLDFSETRWHRVLILTVDGDDYLYRHLYIGASYPFLNKSMRLIKIHTFLEGESVCTELYFR